MLSDMKSSFTIVFAIVTIVESLPQRPCDRLKIGNEWYKKEILWYELGRPYNLNIHKETNTLFFSYTLPENYSDLDFQLAFFNIDSREFQTIAGIRGGCAVAIDQANDEIYLGGSDGIYKYNMVTKLADFYEEPGVNVWSLFYRKHLFYVSYPDQKLRIEVDGKFIIVKEFENIEVDHFYMNNEDVIYFANKTGFYKYNNDKSGTEVLNELITVRQIVEDNDDNLFVCTNMGLFQNKNNNKFENILNMKNVQGLAFDKDNNFVIADEKSIIRLTGSSYGCLDLDSDHW